MVSEGMQKQNKTKKWSSVWSQEEPSSLPGFTIAPALHIIYNHCLPIVIFLVEEWTVANLQGKSGNKKSYFAEAEWNSAHMPQSLHILWLVLLHNSHPGHF